MTVDKQRMQHRLWTIGLAAANLCVLVALALVMPLYTTDLNQYSLLRFPAGFYMAAQGAIIAFVAMIFWTASQQETIDRKLGASEDN